MGGTVSNGASVVTQATDFPPETSNQINKNPNFTDGDLSVAPVEQNATINVAGLSTTYDGNPHAATATATAPTSSAADRIARIRRAIT